MPRHCRHDICETLWSVRDTACYGKNTQFESFQSCFYAEHGLTWIKVTRAKATLSAEPQLFRWSKQVRGVYTHFLDSAFYTRDTLEALTTEHGNELWLGRICAHHRKRVKPESLTDCAVLLIRVQRRIIEAFAIQLLAKACLEHEFYDLTILDIMTEAAVSSRNNHMEGLENAAEARMASCEVDSTEWKVARATSLMARIFSDRGYGTWMTPMKEFLVYILAISGSAKNMFDKFARKRLAHTPPSEMKNEAIACLARLRAVAGRKAKTPASQSCESG